MSSSLSAVLQERLDRIDGGRTLVVSTLDGVELCAGKAIDFYPDHLEINIY